MTESAGDVFLTVTEKDVPARLRQRGRSRGLRDQDRARDVRDRDDRVVVALTGLTVVVGARGGHDIRVLSCRRCRETAPVKAQS